MAITLAYQVASPVESIIYLLSAEDFGATIPLTQILLNFEVSRIEGPLTPDIIDMRTWRQVPPQVLTAVAPAFSETPVPTPEEWRRIVAGQSLRYCPTFSCKTCATVRFVAPSSYQLISFSAYLRASWPEM